MTGWALGPAHHRVPAGRVPGGHDLDSLRVPRLDKVEGEVDVPALAMAGWVFLSGVTTRVLSGTWRIPRHRAGNPFPCLASENCSEGRGAEDCRYNWSRP